MLTVFARNFGSSVLSGQSARFAPGAFPGASWLQSEPESTLKVNNTYFSPGINQNWGDGLTFATWVKPGWNNQQQGAPALFMQLETSSGFNGTMARFGYDSETTNDSIFLWIRYFVDNNPYELWINAPLDNPFNQTVTGLTPSGPTNTWNNVSSSGFVHIAVVLDMTTDSWPEFTTDISPRARIFWNGQVLETFEYFTTSPSNLNLAGFTTSNPIISIGPKIWQRPHNQDRSIYCKTFVSANDVNNHFYANGIPSDPPTVADFHWNYENPTPYNSNGVQPTVLLSQQRTTPGIFPTFDTINFV